MLFAFAACTNLPPASEPPDDGTEDGGSVEGDGGSLSDGGTGGDGGSAGPDGGVATTFEVEPQATQTLQVVLGQTLPTLGFTATLGGKPVTVAWSVDRGEVGTLAASTAPATAFTPSGRVAGLVTVTASLNGQRVDRQVMVNVQAVQDGPLQTPAEQAQIATDVAALTAGGGVGGVGGEGLGTAVGDPSVLAAFASPAGDGQAEELRFLYPYDGTVWPRGMLAPLLMWSWTHGDADAVKLELRTESGSFAWTGTFARPEILATTGGKFVRHPIPQGIWELATNSAGADRPGGGRDGLVVKLIVARQGQAYGPITQTWQVAPARLSGTIYYNSYGTRLARNYTGALGGDGRFGGAVLSIRVGDAGPKLVAGSDGGAAQCRVCHSVAADGSRLVAQHGDNTAASSAYDLGPTGSGPENVLAVGAEFPGVYPDGSLALTPSAQLLALPAGTVVPSVGLTQLASNVGTPMFSPDGRRVAFNPLSGPGVTNARQKLLLMDFDAATATFSNPTTVVDFTGEPAESRPGWPAFLPDGKSLVFHKQSAAGLDGNNLGDLRTRKGARAQLYWTRAEAEAQPTALDRLNGRDGSGVYLPRLPQAISMSCLADGSQVGAIDADHGSDVELNYEPTVNPVGSGGYAWVVFTSRRVYGNVATIPPFCSDPRGVDLVQNVTTKKLWVAAIDLDATPGTDPSHPAFYLPAQELLAGNSRGYWVLDACRAEGADCDTGDQCCDGYCRPAQDGGRLVCSSAPPDTQCSPPNGACRTPADCCDPRNQCSSGICRKSGPS